MTEFLFEVAKGLIIFIGGSTSFICFTIAIKIFTTPKDEWNKTKKVPVINTKTNTWELVSISVIPDCFISQKEKEVYIHLWKGE